MTENDNKKTFNEFTQDLIERLFAKIILLIIDAILLNAALIHFKILPQDNINIFYIMCILYAIK